MGSVRGRDFTDADREGARPVAIVNEELASRIWPGRNPIGQRIRLAGDSMAREIVGVSRNANYGALGEAPQPCLFLPIRQEFSNAAVLYVRTAADPAAVLGTVQQIVRSADPHIDVNDVRTIDTLIGQSLFGASMGVGLLALFGVVALGLASLGLYGAMAFAVRQRRREIGVRIAVGARRHSVIGLVLRQGMAPVATGIVVGGAGAAATGQLISGMLFGVTPLDPISFAIAAAVLVLAASAACLLPAHRASRVDPIAALREP
jgi:predicted permease